MTAIQTVVFATLNRTRQVKISSKEKESKQRKNGIKKIGSGIQYVLADYSI